MPRHDDIHSQPILNLLATRAHPLPVRNGGDGITPVALDWPEGDRPGRPGVYAFWWRRGLDDLWEKIDNRTLVFHGPGGANADEIRLTLEREDFTECEGMVPLYIGKTYQPIAKRVGQHLLLGTARCIPLHEGDRLQARRNAACQVRDRLDRLFHDEADTRKLVVGELALSWVEMDCWKKRFFFEDYAIGYYRPLFNLDCER